MRLIRFLMTADDDDLGSPGVEAHPSKQQSGN
jgi:hypothetical protein